MINALAAPLQRETRFQLRGESEVLVRRRFDCEPREVRGRLLDLTVSGAKFSLDLPLTVEESVTLYFRFGELNLNFMVDAQIRWSRAAAGELWWLGCAFSPKMPDEHLASLAGKGYIEWRPEARRKIDLAAAACWEMTSDKDVPVRIADISSGGVGLRSPHAAAPGQRIIIRSAGGAASDWRFRPVANGRWNATATTGSAAALPTPPALPDFQRSFATPIPPHSLPRRKPNATGYGRSPVQQPRTVAVVNARP